MMNRKTTLFAIILCLCFAVFGASFAETASTEAPKADDPVAEMTAEELYQAGKEAYDTKDYAKALEYFRQAGDLGYSEAIKEIGNLYSFGLGVEKDLDKAAEYYRKGLDAGYIPDEEDRTNLKAVTGIEYQP